MDAELKTAMKETETIVRIEYLRMEIVEERTHEAGHPKRAEKEDGIRKVHHSIHQVLDAKAR